MIIFLDMFRHGKLNPKKVFLDRDRDGITDAIDLQIHLSPSCSSPRVLSSIMDLSACLGFETMAMDLPLVHADQKRDPSFHHHLYVGLYDELEKVNRKGKRHNLFLGAKNETDLAQTIKEFALTLISDKAEPFWGPLLKKEEGRKGFDPLNPFSLGGFYSGSLRTPLTVLAPYKILLFSDLDLETAVGAANFAARLGLEALSLSLPLTFTPEDRPKGVKNWIYVGKREDLNRVGLKRSEHPFDSRWKSGIFLLPSEKKMPDVLICGEGEGLRGILNHLSQIPMSSKGAEDAVSNSIRKYFDQLKEFVLGKGEKVGVPKEIVREYGIPDEKKEIVNILRRGLERGREKINSAEIKIFMTRPEKERKDFGRKIRRWLRKSGISENKIGVFVLNAYKPGLSWMREVCLREVSGMKIDRVEVAFKEFREDGLEEPIRWLQEIYPVDEIFASRLSIPKEKIEFKKDSRMKEIYRVRAWQKGKIVYEKSFSPKWIEQPYLSPFPKLGKIHPTTGWVKMKVDGKEIVNQRVKIGIERIWEIYQGKLLMLIEKEALKVLSEKGLPPSTPVFEEVRFDVFFKYPMESLDIDEERVSPLEALHEEFYFVTLDFFSNLLKNKGLRNLSSGRIIPIIHPEFRGNGGKFKFTLVHKPRQAEPYGEMGEIQIALNGVLFNRSKTGIDFFIELEKEDNFKRLKDRLRLFNPRGHENFKITGVFKEGSSPGKRLRVQAVGKNLTIKGKSSGKIRISENIPMDRPIGYREGVRLLQSFGRLSGVRVLEEGRSFGGLPLYSLENTYPCQSLFVSRAKQIVFKPTFFINCRHHSNEISSTNASLKLSCLLATQPQYQKLLKRTNVVLNPMENVDGMVILEEMSRWAPTDKLHAGRYNGAGQEYYKEYLNSNTPFGEARVKPSIWERWLPDICVDNHGFPSHEWDQPFSGYAPYRFRDFWIPRALLYVYLPHIEEKSESRERFNAKTLGDWISWYISEDRAITELNEKYSERYYKYRGQWLGKSSRIIKTLQFLPLQKKFQKTNYSYLQPDITVVDFITEVADETAWRNRLKTCISAHLKTNLAVINLLNNLKFNVKKIWLTDGRMDQFIWHRERPLEFRSRGASKQ
jgi:hypothetical protein